MWSISPLPEVMGRTKRDIIAAISDIGNLSKVTCQAYVHQTQGGHRGQVPKHLDQKAEVGPQRLTWDWSGQNPESSLLVITLFTPGEEGKENAFHSHCTQTLEALSGAEKQSFSCELSLGTNSLA